MRGPFPPLMRDTGQGRVRTVIAALALGLLTFGPAGVLLWRWWPPPAPLPLQPPAAPASVRMPASIAVELGTGMERIRVDSPGGGAWYSGAGKERRAVAVGGGPWTVEADDGGLILNGQKRPEDSLELRCVSGRFELDGRPFRGRLLVGAAGRGKLTVRNVIGPELYVRSVVGSEMYAHWPLAALMAQAVAARTFTLYSLEAKGYLSRTDMAYGGIARERPAATLATDLTRGMILVYGGKVLPAYFHSTCGGHTVPVEKVFSLPPTPPLRGVECHWCRQSPTYRWRVTVPAVRIWQAVRARLGESAGPIGSIVSVVPLGRGGDGYATAVEINGRFRMPVRTFRRAIGADLLKSPCFTVRAEDGEFVFEGRGHGHGVGLCQWGARGLAEAGRSWQDILSYYYPGARLCRAR